MSFLFRRVLQAPTNPSQAEQESQNFRRTVIFLLVWMALSAAVLMICAIRDGLANPLTPWQSGLQVFCEGILLGLDFAAVGGLIGFLFGIPKSDSGAPEKPQEVSGKDKTNDTAGRAGQTTNLEQVSDWLTKIILGAGLTQITKIPTAIKGIGDYLAADFGGHSLIPEAIAVHSVVLGFFTGYLITRLFLAGAFVLADHGLSPNARISQALRLSDAQADNQKYDAAAATLETAINSIGPDTPPETKLLYFERLTYTALYEPEPTGFLKAIGYAKRYLREEPQHASGRLFVNLACAYGQQYSWERKHDNRTQVLEEIRQSALDAVREALRLDQGSKNVLKLVWDPKASKMSDEENDLEGFYEDAEFQALLGT
jgi:hypothetical protein